MNTYTSQTASIDGVRAHCKSRSLAIRLGTTTRPIRTRLLTGAEERREQHQYKCSHSQILATGKTHFMREQHRERGKTSSPGCDATTLYINCQQRTHFYESNGILIRSTPPSTPHTHPKHHHRHHATRSLASTHGRKARQAMVVSYCSETFTLLYMKISASFWRRALHMTLFMGQLLAKRQMQPTYKKSTPPPLSTSYDANQRHRLHRTGLFISL